MQDRRSAPGTGGCSLADRRARTLNAKTDPRITRTIRAFEQAIVELASARPVSQISVAQLAERAGVTRATFYNRYTTPLELLIHVLHADLDRGHRLENQRAMQGHSPVELLRLATAEVADHVERFRSIYELSLGDPADSGVLGALVRHFHDYTLAFMAHRSPTELPDANRQVIAQFMAHGFAGAIRAWLSDPAVTKDEMVDAAVACAPAWWAPGRLPHTS
ncbi:TetR/AcrR family transcriptional regulator [Streptomyces sp. S.PB5]|uniref:TetR/AcrR family transcriptional regulator n=1 Tax=Streptomyces sp. S.PB5 TaxID=3020844 RepID=UPI0025B0787D|nr:TetR/AcrR family transcriptional regulator [Streptomyces sp. S.PB5]MDN3028334.1 TetR/AcrR family transcriptional regulator [Streptomyces sp. S.PB5]